MTGILIQSTITRVKTEISSIITMMIFHGLPHAQFPLIINGPFFRLPCVVDRLEGFVMLWKKNGEIITVASQIIDKVCDMIRTMIMLK